MAIRTTPAEVAELIPGLEGQSIDFAPFIVTASLIVDDLVVAASQEGKTISDDRAAQIEKYMAAHFAALCYGLAPIAANQVGAASERYHNIYEPGLRASPWGQHAMMLDPSTYLAKMADKVEQPSTKQAMFEVV